MIFPNFAKMKKHKLFLVCLIVMIGCKSDSQKQTEGAEKPGNKEKLNTDFRVHTEKITSKNMDTCQSVECPQINVSYLKIETQSEFGENFNAKNTEGLTSIFSTSAKKSSFSTVEEAIDEFKQDYFQFKADFPQTPTGYEANISQEIINRNERLVVLKTTFYLFTGGAHGFGGMHYLNFDAETGKIESRKDLISDMDKFRDYAEKKFRKKFEVGSEAKLNAKGFFFEDDNFALPENMAFLPNKVILHYNPYEAGSYAQGNIRLSIPKKEVGEWLNY